jgi:hypothetical protein
MLRANAGGRPMPAEHRPRYICGNNRLSLHGSKPMAAAVCQSRVSKRAFVGFDRYAGNLRLANNSARIMIGPSQRLPPAQRMIGES